MSGYVSPAVRRIRMASTVRRATPLALLAVLLSACAAFAGYGGNCPKVSRNTPPVSPMLVRAVWELRFGALPETCPTWSWEVWPLADMDRVCRNVVGCTIFPAGCPLSVTTADHASDKLLAAHELTHAFAWCATNGDGDPGHLRAELWGPNGFVANLPL